MGIDGVAQTVRSRLGIDRLKFGTAITGAAALLLVPMSAQAATNSSPYKLSAPSVATPGTQDNVQYDVLPVAAPRDLTVRATATHRLDAAGNGDVTISDGNVSTTGNYAPGIAVTSTGATTITAGAVSTTGNQSDGITVSGSGPISIAASSVSTTGGGSYRYGATGGNGSYGIRAIGGGDIAINVGTVTTTGAFAGGILAYSPTGNISINAGSIDATGHGAIGIYATGNDLTITTGSIDAGLAGINLFAVGAGASVNLTVNGDVSATDKLATGISISSYGDITVHDSGTITTTSTQTGITKVGGGGGILLNAVGNITVDGGTNIITNGVGEQGVVANSLTGDVSLDLGSITTHGGEAGAITASTVNIQYNFQTQTYTTTVGGNVSIAVDNIKTYGRDSGGILAAGANVDITVKGAISTYGGFSTGITAVAYAGDVAIHNNGSITTTYAGSSGIYAKATGNVTIDGGGSIAVAGSGASGIVALSTGGGAISITTGDIATSGNGIYAESIAGNGYQTSGITISTGNVTTLESGHDATGIFATNKNRYGNVAIDTGNVTTRGDYASAIVALAVDGNISINTGDVTTRGLGAFGILTEAGSVDIAAGTVSTSGDDAPGIFAFAGLTPSGTGHITITGNAVSTQGNGSEAIYARSEQGDLTINVGTVTTQGRGSVGVYAYSSGTTQVSINALSTAGDAASGLVAVSAGDATNSVIVNAGTVSTTGTKSNGIAAVAKNAQVDINAGTVTTSGVNAAAIVGYSQFGTATVKAGTVATTGMNAFGIYANGGSGATIVGDTITTSGDVSNAVVVRSGGYGLSGDASVTVGSVTTNGKQSAGIDALVLGIGATGTSSLTIDAGSITTNGIDSPGISAFDNYGAINITTSAITTKGAESVGIIAVGGQDITINAGSISTLATSIYAQGSGDGAIAINVAGKVQSTGYSAIVAINQAGSTAISVGAGGSAIGAGDGIQVQSGGGNVTITNAGTIAGGEGYAIDVSGIVNYTPAGAGAPAGSPNPETITGDPATTITNTGTIVGAVRLLGSSATLTNSGLFVATKDSTFGTGNGVFVNTGTVGLASATKPTAISFLGLGKFTNSGIIDLRNGVAGDTLTLTGNYVGSGNAELGLDVGANGVADKLVVAGVASGTTRIVLNTTPATATLLPTPVTVVQAGAGTAANAFTLAGGDVGFVSYGLSFNGASDSFQLTTAAGSSVHRLTKANQGAQAIFGQSADAWSSHLAELRDGDQSGKAAWGQMYGQIDHSHDHQGGYDLGYSQDYFGFQTGVDLAHKQAGNGTRVLFGVTAGYLSSDLNLTAGAERLRYDTFNLGAYANLRAGALFVNLLGQYDHYRTNADNKLEHWADSFNGNGYGGQAEFGARFGSGTVSVEPIATLAWQRTDLGTLQAFGQSLDFGHDSAATGTIGGRFSDTLSLKGGAQAVVYAKASYVHEFGGKGDVLFQSGGTSQDVAGSRIGDYGKLAVGVDILSSDRVSGFIEADGDVGSGLRGGGGRAGLRIKL